MKKFSGLFALSILFIVACAPAAGRPAVPYLAAPQEVISAVAQLGPTLPAPSGYNFFSIETIGDTYITLRTDPTTGLNILGALGGTRSQPIRITVTTLEQSSITQVAISGLPQGSAGAAISQIEMALDQRFKRAG